MNACDWTVSRRLLRHLSHSFEHVIGGSAVNLDPPARLIELHEPAELRLRDLHVELNGLEVRMDLHNGRVLALLVDVDVVGDQLRLVLRDEVNSSDLARENARWAQMEAIRTRSGPPA